METTTQYVDCQLALSFTRPFLHCWLPLSPLLQRHPHHGAGVAAYYAGDVALAGEVLGEQDVAGAEALGGAVADLDLALAVQRDDVLAAGAQCQSST